MFSLFARSTARGARVVSLRHLVRNELLESSSRLFHTTKRHPDFHENDRLSHANAAQQTIISNSHASSELMYLVPLFEQGGYDPSIRLSNYVLTKSEKRKRHMIAAILSTRYVQDNDFPEQVTNISDKVTNPLPDDQIRRLHTESVRQIKEKYHKHLEMLPLSHYLLNANIAAGFILSPQEMNEAIYLLMANQLTQVIADRLFYRSISTQMDTLETSGDLSSLPSTVGSNLTVGIVGGIGSGKSTIANSILSQYLKNTRGVSMDRGAFISSDVFKLLLYADNPDLRSHNGGTLTHEESKSMFNLALSVRYRYSQAKKPIVTIIDRIAFGHGDMALLQNDRNTSLLMLGTNRGNVENVLEGVKKRGQSNSKDPRVIPTKTLLTSYKKVAQSFLSIARQESAYGSVFKLYDTEEAIKAKFSSSPESVTPIPTPSHFATLSVKDKSLSIFNIEQLIDFIKHKHINIHAKSRDELYTQSDKISIKNLLHELLKDLSGYRMTFYSNADSSEKVAEYEENVLNILDEEKYSMMKREAPEYFDALESVMCMSKTPSLSI